MIAFACVYMVAAVMFVPGSILTLGAGFAFAQAFGQGGKRGRPLALGCSVINPTTHGALLTLSATAPCPILVAQLVFWWARCRCWLAQPRVQHSPSFWHAMPCAMLSPAVLPSTAYSLPSTEPWRGRASKLYVTHTEEVTSIV